MGTIEGPYDGEIERHHSLYGNGVFELNFPFSAAIMKSRMHPHRDKKKILKRLN